MTCSFELGPTNPTQATKYGQLYYKLYDMENCYWLAYLTSKVA